jgi:hypothetical protein
LRRSISRCAGLIFIVRCSPLPIPGGINHHKINSRELRCVIMPWKTTPVLYVFRAAC